MGSSRMITSTNIGDSAGQKPTNELTTAPGVYPLYPGNDFCAVPVFPGAKSFAVAQDRLIEKDFLTGLGIPVAPYARVDTSEDLRAALSRVRVPALLKTRRFGYDGKGQILIRAADEILAALEAVGQAPALIEGTRPTCRAGSILSLSRSLRGAV